MSNTDNFVETILTALAAQATQVKLGDQAVALVPNNHSLQPLERYQAAPDFYRATLSTDNVFHFIDYVKTHACANSVVCVNTQQGSAEAIIDAGSTTEPQWGHHRAKLKLEKSAAFQALEKQDGNWRTQRDFIYFLEDWAEDIQFIYGEGNETPSDFETGLKLIKKLKFSRKVEAASEVGNHSSTGSVMDSVGVSSNEDELPIGFTFSCDMYDDYAPVDLVCRLQSRISENNINLCYSIRSLAAVKEQAGSQLFNDLNFEGNRAKTYKGVIKYQGV
jgi:uncharacterized protein YfdQ (DUF2303 family)